MNKAKSHLWILVAAFGFLSTGCPGGDDGGSSPRVSPIYAAGPPELTYCSSAISHGGSTVTITGSAVYKARQILTGVGLGAPGSGAPIRYAEVRVTDAAGSVAQCAETDNSGNFSLVLPQNSSSYTISINSRGNSSTVVASVLNKPEYNTVYSLTTTVVPDSTKSVGTLTAEGTGDVLAGAFNIYDQIVKVNEYLRAQVGTCSFSGCQAFTVAPKVQAYWEKGFNPADYFGAGNGGVSFYLPGYSRLFILGGVNGDINSSDTDHFDNAVIIHEYGHFIEDVLTDSDSPGGRHNGNAVIDPRLAWGEGWGNFIQAAVLNDPTYIDTVGNIDGSTDFAIYVDVESADADCGGATPPPICDVPENPGEGNFREFEITRFLWDLIDTNEDASPNEENISNGFPEVWTVLTSASGFKNPLAGFRSIGLLHDVQDNLPGRENWDPLRSLAAHQHGIPTSEPNGYRKDWAIYMTSGSCSLGSGYQVSITPTGSKSSRHLLLNNDFYHYRHAGGAFDLTLRYQTQSGAEADLDLYVYDESGRVFGDGAVDIADATSTEIGKSTSEPDGTIGTAQTETVSLSLNAGNYLIQVQAYVSLVPGGPTDYELEVGGNDICPAASP